MGWILNTLLLPFSGLYLLVTFVRNKLFDWKILPSESFSVPIICVGNLAIGGTGKTPHTELLLRILSSDYQYIAVLSRGYGRRTRGFYWVDNNSLASDVGDEPLQMRKKFFSSKYFFAVCENRRKGIRRIMAEHPEIQLILLDDAFQHRYVQAGLNILLTEYSNIYNKDWLLPMGKLRECSSGSRRAHIIIVTKCPEDIDASIITMKQRELNLKAEQQLYFTTINYDFPETSLNKVLLLTGIANAHYLSNYLTKRGVLFEHLHFGDHHNFSKKDCREIIARGSKFDRIITTEKDLMRIEELDLPLYIRQKISVIKIAPSFLFNAEYKFIATLNRYVNSYQTNC